MSLFKVSLQDTGGAQ